MNDGAGTCPMGNPHTSKHAVVNSKLQVVGVKNLRVVDASIMPTIVSGQTQAAVMMIAEKAADMINEVWLTAENMVALGSPSLLKESHNRPYAYNQHSNKKHVLYDGAGYNDNHKYKGTRYGSQGGSGWKKPTIPIPLHPNAFDFKSDHHSLATREHSTLLKPSHQFNNNVVPITFQYTKGSLPQDYEENDLYSEYSNNNMTYPINPRVPTSSFEIISTTIPTESVLERPPTTMLLSEESSPTEVQQVDNSITSYSDDSPDSMVHDLLTQGINTFEAQEQAMSSFDTAASTGSQSFVPAPPALLQAYGFLNQTALNGTGQGMQMTAESRIDEQREPKPNAIRELNPFKSSNNNNVHYVFPADSDNNKSPDPQLSESHKFPSFYTNRQTVTKPPIFNYPFFESNNNTNRTQLYQSWIKDRSPATVKIPDIYYSVKDTMSKMMNEYSFENTTADQVNKVVNPNPYKMKSASSSSIYWTNAVPLVQHTTPTPRMMAESSNSQSVTLETVNGNSYRTNGTPRKLPFPDEFTHSTAPVFKHRRKELLDKPNVTYSTITRVTSTVTVKPETKRSKNDSTVKAKKDKAYTHTTKDGLTNKENSTNQNKEQSLNQVGAAYSNKGISMTTATASPMVIKSRPALSIIDPSKYTDIKTQVENKWKPNMRSNFVTTVKPKNPFHKWHVTTSEPQASPTMLLAAMASAASALGHMASIGGDDSDYDEKSEEHGGENNNNWSNGPDNSGPPPWSKKPNNNNNGGWGNRPSNNHNNDYNDGNNHNHSNNNNGWGKNNDGPKDIEPWNNRPRGNNDGNHQSNGWGHNNGNRNRPNSFNNNGRGHFSEPNGRPPRPPNDHDGRSQNSFNSNNNHHQNKNHGGWSSMGPSAPPFGGNNNFNGNKNFPPLNNLELNSNDNRFNNPHFNNNQNRPNFNNNNNNFGPNNNNFQDERNGPPQNNLNGNIGVNQGGFFTSQVEIVSPSNSVGGIKNHPPINSPLFSQMSTITPPGIAQIPVFPTVIDPVDNMEMISMLGEMHRRKEPTVKPQVDIKIYGENQPDPVKGMTTTVTPVLDEAKTNSSNIANIFPEETERSITGFSHDSDEESSERVLRSSLKANRRSFENSALTGRRGALYTADKTRKNSKNLLLKSAHLTGQSYSYISRSVQTSNSVSTSAPKNYNVYSQSSTTPVPRTIRTTNAPQNYRTVSSTTLIPPNYDSNFVSTQAPHNYNNVQTSRLQNLNSNFKTTLAPQTFSGNPSSTIEPQLFNTAFTSAPQQYKNNKNTLNSWDQGSNVLNTDHQQIITSNSQNPFNYNHINTATPPNNNIGSTAAPPNAYGNYGSTSDYTNSHSKPQKQNNYGNKSTPQNQNTNHYHGSTSNTQNQNNNYNYGSGSTQSPQNQNSNYNYGSTSSPQKQNNNHYNYGSTSSPQNQNSNHNYGTTPKPLNQHINHNYEVTPAPPNQNNYQTFNSNSGTQDQNNNHYYGSTLAPQTESHNEHFGTTPTPQNQNFNDNTHFEADYRNNNLINQNHQQHQSQPNPDSVKEDPNFNSIVNSPAFKEFVKGFLNILPGGIEGLDEKAQKELAQLGILDDSYENDDEVSPEDENPDYIRNPTPSTNYGVPVSNKGLENPQSTANNEHKTFYNEPSDNYVAPTTQTNQSYVSPDFPNLSVSLEAPNSIEDNDHGRNMPENYDKFIGGDTTDKSYGTIDVTKVDLTVNAKPNWNPKGDRSFTSKLNTTAITLTSTPSGAEQNYNVGSTGSSILPKHDRVPPPVISAFSNENLEFPVNAIQSSTTGVRVQKNAEPTVSNSLNRIPHGQNEIQNPIFQGNQNNLNQPEQVASTNAANSGGSHILPSLKVYDINSDPDEVDITWDQGASRFHGFKKRNGIALGANLDGLNTKRKRRRRKKGRGNMIHNGGSKKRIVRVKASNPNDDLISIVDDEIPDSLVTKTGS